MDRIAQAFATAKSEKRAAFVSYVCGGDPDAATSLAVLKALADNGADILEIGVPFSDPLADGLTNQLAAQRALESGMTHDKFFALIRDLRAHTQKPVVLYTYYNLIYSQGVEAYVKRCAEAGIDGLLALDCPPEEASELIVACKKHALANIFIVAPTTPPARVKLIAEHASGFIYYVSRTGVTGERSDLAADMSAAVSEIRKHAKVPVVVGFGISTPEHVRAVGAIADGVVVGSALVNVVAANKDTRSAAAPAIAEKTRHLASGLRA
jgi:tryptophan synthase alpha chain